MRSLSLLVLALNASNVSAQEPIRIFAATSLTDALAEVAAEFESTRPGTKVVFQFGSSSDLARQILAGAPAHLFFSADTRQMDRVSALVDAYADVLSNQLVIARRLREADIDPGDLETLDRIAMADPEAVPAGVYAKQYLESRGLWSRLRSRIVPTLDVRGALAAVASGNVDAGFVYRTDAAIDRRVKIAHAVPREEGPTIVYRLGMLMGSGKRARRFFDYLQLEAAGVTFERFGFIFLP